MWNSLASFYASDEWMTLRRQLLNERDYRCEQCDTQYLKDLSQINAHHKIELTVANVNDYHISLNPKNITLLCIRCHNIKHGRAVNVDKHVYLVYGPPLSGITEYVTEHLNRGDLIVDMDMIYQAISGRPQYDKPGQLTGMAFAIHDLLIDKIATRTGKWFNAWVIGGYADKYRREQMIKRIGAEPVFMECSRDECIRRIAVDCKGDEWIKFIDNWFELYKNTTPPA